MSLCLGGDSNWLFRNFKTMFAPPAFFKGWKLTRRGGITER
jgi:hypothetical protein